jgi:hypothetical protein
MSKMFRSPTATAVLLVGLGFVFVFFGWNGAAGKDSIQQQFPYILSGGIIGLGLILGGLTVAVVQTMRRESATLAAKLDELADALGRVGEEVGVAVSPTAVPDHGDLVMAGRTTYHRPDCRLIEGRGAAQAMSPAAAASRGLSPCRICNPAAA